MSEEIKTSETTTENAVKNNVQMNSKNEILNALRSKFATSVNKVYINSIGEEVGFREITVAEQKTLSRIMMDNEQRKDVIYDTECSIINKTCLNDGFDIYNLTEFDKIKLQLAMYQSNVAKNEITFTCEECGTDNKYKMDFKNAIRNLDSFDVSDRIFQYENDSFKYEFTVGYPTVRKVSRFYKDIIQKLKKSLYDSSNETTINIEYVTMFIKKVEMTNGGDKMVIDLEDLNSGDISEIISEFPQDVMYNENGLLKYITSELIEKINSSFDKHKCLQCGHYQAQSNVSTTSDFFS